MVCTYSRAILGLTVLFVVVAHFVEVVLVQLSNETGKIAVLEVLGKDVLRKLLVLLGCQLPAHARICDSRQRTSNTTKLSPSFPHLTTLSSLGFSNILARTLAFHLPLLKPGHILVELAHLRTLLAPSDTSMRFCKRTKSLELLEPEPPAALESMMAGVKREAFLRVGIYGCRGRQFLKKPVCTSSRA